MATLSASFPACQSSPAWSMNCFSWAAMFPKRVGVPNATPSAHSRSSSDATGASATSERCRPQYWFCEISSSEASSSTWRNRTSASASSAPAATACASPCTLPVAL